jgi:hypothetical protein
MSITGQQLYAAFKAEEAQVVNPAQDKDYALKAIFNTVAKAMNGELGQLADDGSYPDPNGPNAGGLSTVTDETSA